MRAKAKSRHIFEFGSDYKAVVTVRPQARWEVLTFEDRIVLQNSVVAFAVSKEYFEENFIKIEED